MGSMLAVEADEACGKGSIYLRIVLHILYIALNSALDVPQSALEELYIAVRHCTD